MKSDSPNCDKHQLLLWSGGCDSTLSLYRALTSGYRVRTLSITHPQVCAEKESRAARDALIKQLGVMGHSWPHSEITLTQDGPVTGERPAGGAGLAQPAIWLSVAMTYLTEHEDLVMSYIKSDDAIHFKGWLCAIFDNFKGLTGKKGSLCSRLSGTPRPRSYTTSREHAYTT